MPSPGCRHMTSKRFHYEPDDIDRTESFTSAPLTPTASRRLIPEAFWPVLIAMNGSHRGIRYKLVNRETIIGRSRDADFLISDNGISRKHFRIIYENHDRAAETPVCYLEDLDSRNGTQVNARPIAGVVRLAERDRIIVGRTILGFFFRDEEELLQDEHLYESATRDPLTGLDNRRQLISHLRHYIGLAHRNQSQLCFALMDLDFFKKVNDNYGHSTGDEALKHFASILSGCVRDSDLVARWGGEEFAACLPESSLRGAQTFAERVRRELEGKPLVHNGAVISMTVSIGIAQCHPEDTMETIFDRADQCLYQGKHLGKNRVITELELPLG